MTTVQRALVAAAIINGLALAAALLGRPGLAAAGAAIASTLCAWSIEQLRAATVREIGR